MLETLGVTLRGLIDAADQLQDDAPSRSQLEEIVARGDFRPAEDEAIGFWFARFLTVRDNLWNVINDVRSILYNPVDPISDDDELRHFLVGYAAVCILIRIDRIMLFEVGYHSLIQRKLSHLKRAWSYVSHKWRRRGVVSAEKLFATVLEGFGRAASELCDMENKRVTSVTVRTISEFLQPGDVIVTRHAKALTNLFFPGFWPHAALYVGTPEQRQAANIYVGPDKEHLWVNDICVLEAQKDGVLLRPLRETLTVDTFAILRPNLTPQNITSAIERALLHEGKLYNFDFNFFNSDRIVCTEVIYRAYDGLEGLEFPLCERAGRKTLSAEDLLDFALETGTFTPVAIFGVKDCKDSILFGDGVRDALVASYRRSS